MNLKFAKDIPLNYNKETQVISGEDSLEFTGKEYLISENKDICVFEIRYECHCSSFKEAMVLDNILAVGHEEYFYLYNLNTNSTVLKFKVDGYFGKLYLHNGLFYIADASGIRCINKEGNILWANNNLAIDGVIINKFEDAKIYGIGEQDPPGGWEDFILDLSTGQKIK
jgi:hypothetical protein